MLPGPLTFLSTDSHWYRQFNDAGRYYGYGASGYGGYGGYMAGYQYPVYQVNTAVRPPPPPPPPEEIEPTVEPVRTVTLATCLMKWFLNFKL